LVLAPLEYAEKPIAPVNVVCGYADTGINKIAAKATERHARQNKVVRVIANPPVDQL
jgi:hypothetical protein